jgi:hypothetical protein
MLIFQQKSNVGWAKRSVPISLSSFPQMNCFWFPLTGEPEALFVLLAG